MLGIFRLFEHSQTQETAMSRVFPNNPNTPTFVTNQGPEPKESCANGRERQMTEENGTTRQAELNWRQAINDTRSTAEVLRETLHFVEQIEAEGVTVGEIVLAFRVTTEDGSEGPMVTSSVGSPMVQIALAQWLNDFIRQSAHDVCLRQMAAYGAAQL